MKHTKFELLLGLTRIGLGWIFFWPFIDKVFGLGFGTLPEAAWINGGSPTTGFLKFATKGPFAEMFKPLAGNGLVDALFMGGLLLIGIALIFGVAVRLGCYSGALMLFLMWLAVLPPEHNPVIDDHIIYALALLAIAHAPTQAFSVRRLGK